MIYTQQQTTLPIMAVSLNPQVSLPPQDLDRSHLSVINSSMYQQHPHQLFPMSLSHTPGVHPYLWSRDMVKRWLYWAAWEFSLTDIDPDQFEMNGKALCLLPRQSFTLRAPKSGDILFEILQTLCRQGAQYTIPGKPHYNLISIHQCKQLAGHSPNAEFYQPPPQHILDTPIAHPRSMTPSHTVTQILNQPKRSYPSHCQTLADDTGAVTVEMRPHPTIVSPTKSPKHEREQESTPRDGPDGEGGLSSSKRKRPEDSPVSRSPQHYKKLRLLPATEQCNHSNTPQSAPGAKTWHIEMKDSAHRPLRSDPHPAPSTPRPPHSLQIDPEHRRNSKFVRYSPTRPGPRCTQVPVIVTSGAPAPLRVPQGSEVYQNGYRGAMDGAFVTGHPHTMVPVLTSPPVQQDYYSYAVSNGLICPMPGVPTVLVHAQPTHSMSDTLTLEQGQEERMAPPTPRPRPPPKHPQTSPHDGVEKEMVFRPHADSPCHKSCLNSSGESDMSSVSSEDDVTSTVDVPVATLPDKTSTELPISRKTRVRMSQAVNEKGTRLLWNFLFSLLNDATFTSVIQWVRPEEHVFRIVDSQTLAKLWGENKQRENMTYEKMARGLRYYYSAGIIQKEPGRRLMYRFVKNPNEIRGRRRGRRPGITIKKLDPIAA